MKSSFTIWRVIPALLLLTLNISTGRSNGRKRSIASHRRDRARIAESKKYNDFENSQSAQSSRMKYIRIGPLWKDQQYAHFEYTPGFGIGVDGEWDVISENKRKRDIPNHRYLEDFSSRRTIDYQDSTDHELIADFPLTKKQVDMIISNASVVDAIAYSNTSLCSQDGVVATPRSNIFFRGPETIVKSQTPELCRNTNDGLTDMVGANLTSLESFVMTKPNHPQNKEIGSMPMDTDATIQASRNKPLSLGAFHLLVRSNTDKHDAASMLPEETTATSPSVFETIMPSNEQIVEHESFGSEVSSSVPVSTSSNVNEMSISRTGINHHTTEIPDYMENKSNRPDLEMHGTLEVTIVSSSSPSMLDTSGFEAIEPSNEQTIETGSWYLEDSSLTILSNTNEMTGSRNEHDDDTSYIAEEQEIGSARSGTDATAILEASMSSSSSPLMLVPSGIETILPSNEETLVGQTWVLQASSFAPVSITSNMDKKISPRTSSPLSSGLAVEDMTEQYKYLETPMIPTHDNGVSLKHHSSSSTFQPNDADTREAHNFEQRTSALPITRESGINEEFVQNSFDGISSNLYDHHKSSNGEDDPKQGGKVKSKVSSKTKGKGMTKGKGKYVNDDTIEPSWETEEPTYENGKGKTNGKGHPKQTGKGNSSSAGKGSSKTKGKGMTKGKWKGKGKQDDTLEPETFFPTFETAEPVEPQTPVPAIVPTRAPTLAPPPTEPQPPVPIPPPTEPQPSEPIPPPANQPTRAPSETGEASSQFCVEYTTLQGSPNADQLREARILTCNHIENYIREELNRNSAVNLESTTCIETSNTSGPPPTVCLNLTITVSADSEFTPSIEDVDILVTVSLNPPTVTELITNLGSLPSSNPLSGTTQVTKVSPQVALTRFSVHANIPDGRITSESPLKSTISSFCVFALLFGVALRGCRNDDKSHDSEMGYDADAILETDELFNDLGSPEAEQDSFGREILYEV